MTRYTWASRISRAELLSKTHHESAEVLSFYGSIARFQSTVYQDFLTRAETSIDPLLDHADGLLRVVEKSAPMSTRDAARRLRSEPARWEALLREHWENPASRGSLDEFELFFVRALLQPYAEFLSEKSTAADLHAPSACPFCSALPGVAILRGEGEGAKRSLLCSLCATEWEFRRLLCPSCGEEAKDNLPVYLAEGLDSVRVEACETCHCYINAVDLTKDGHAIPVIDEIAAVSLNLWAEESGYRKFQPNLMGM